MKFAWPNKILFIVFLVTFVLAGNLFAQTNEKEQKQVNFPYSKNPRTKSAKKETKQADKSPKKNGTKDSNKANNKNQRADKKEKPSTNAETEKTLNQETKAEKTNGNKNETGNPEIKKIETANLDSQDKSPDEQNLPVEFESRSVANKTLEIAENEGKKSISPTEIYKVGVGDILLISLQNAPPNVSTYFTVLNNGAIDYPLAGGMSFVLGLTTEEIENELRKKIKLYKDPQISVKVREHSSHSITVLGLVEKPGIKYLQREAVPLYVIRAEAIAQPRANQVAIRRAENEEVEQLSLLDSKNDDVLIFPGDIVEFSSIALRDETQKIPQFYYIDGVSSGGQKDFYAGMTLTQAILASGGLEKPNVKKVIIRRKNEKGLLVSSVFNLKSIKNGKVPDPLLQPGDTIEVEN